MQISEPRGALAATSRPLSDDAVEVNGSQPPALQGQVQDLFSPLERHAHESVHHSISPRGQSQAVMPERDHRWCPSKEANPVNASWSLVLVNHDELGSRQIPAAEACRQGPGDDRISRGIEGQDPRLLLITRPGDVSNHQGSSYAAPTAGGQSRADGQVRKASLVGLDTGDHACLMLGYPVKGVDVARRHGSEIAPWRSQARSAIHRAQREPHELRELKGVTLARTLEVCGQPLRPMMRSATNPVQPVWCEAPSPAPSSPWKYS